MLITESLIIIGVCMVALIGKVIIELTTKEDEFYEEDED